MNVKNIRKKLQGFVKHEKHETGFLGRADGTVRVPGKLHWVYVRLWNGDVIEAFNNGDVPTAFGLAVEVEYRGSRYYLAPRDSYEQPVFVGLPDGAEDELQWPGLHTLYVRPEQFLPGLVIPKSGLTVIVHGGSLPLAGGGYLIVPTQEIDLTPYVPASNAIWVTLGWSNSGTVLIQTGGAANSIGELSTSNIPATGGFDLAAIKMFNGQTSISHGKFGSMITDLRFFKPSFNADLTGIAALSGTGFARRTGPNTWSAIELPLSDGWIAGTGTWSFGSADAPSYVININADMTSVLQPGYRIRLVQTTTKYFIVTAVGAFSGGFTPVTVYGGTDYTLVNAAITSPHWSIAKTPFGFPLDSQKWTVEVTDSAEHQQASPVASTWYNPGGLSITIPIGSWRITKAVCVRLLASPASVAQYSVRSTLSASNSSESDNDYHDVLLVPQPAGTNLNTYATHWKQKNELLAAKSTRYMNVMTGSSGATLIAIGGNIAKTILRAECLYL